MPDPLRLMRDFMSWDPFQEMEPRWPTASPTTFSPSFEVKETKDAYLFHADVPGVREQDLEVTLVGNRLTVSGKREEDKEDRNHTYYACERMYGSFSRSFTMPDGADLEHIRADLKVGVLSIVIPKKPDVQPRRVAISSSEKAPRA
jgi:HSP20 family protein